LLIIDDLGVERSTDFALEQVYAVVNERYKSGLPLIVTTNLAISEIREAQDEAHDRIFSRLLEMCTPIQIQGNDRRVTISKEKHELTEEVLFRGEKQSN
jgi:DNA replication protein DnaC